MKDRELAHFDKMSVAREFCLNGINLSLVRVISDFSSCIRCTYSIDIDDECVYTVLDDRDKADMFYAKMVLEMKRNPKKIKE